MILIWGQRWHTGQLGCCCRYCWRCRRKGAATQLLELNSQHAVSVAAWFCGNVPVAVAITITGSHCPSSTQNPTARVDKGKMEMQIEDVRACVRACVCV